MARAHVREVIWIKNASTGNLQLGAGATVQVMQPYGSSTPFSGNVWNAEAGGSTIGSTLPTVGASGIVEFWLDSQQDVDLSISLSGYTTSQYTVSALDTTDTLTSTGGGVLTTSSSPTSGDLTGTGLNLSVKSGAITSGKLASGAATGAALGPDVATLSAGKLSPLSQAQQVIASSDLTDSATASLVKSQSLWVNSSGKLFNILHAYNPMAYGAVGDGSTDDSTAINAALSDISAAGRGYLVFPGQRQFACKNIVLYPKSVLDLNGARLNLHSSAGNSDDLIQTHNFNSYTGTSTSVAGGAPYGFEIRNGFLFNLNSNVGRNIISIYGLCYRLSNLSIVTAGVGHAIWQEYTNSTDWTVNQPNQYEATKSTIIENVSVLDATTTSGVNYDLPTSHDMSLSVTNFTFSGSTGTVTTSQPHLLGTTAQQVTLSSIGGITGASGTFTVTGFPANNQFTISGSFSGTYTSGGTATYHVSACWVNLGPSDQQWSNIYAFASTHVGGRRGILFGAANSNSSAGCDISNIHVYNNWDVGIDALDGGIQISNGQLEGSYRCCLLLRGGNGRSNIRSRVYGGFGGVTLVSIRSSHENMLDLVMAQGGSGNAPPSGYNNIYLETYGADDLTAKLGMAHDYNTNCKAASGTAPANGIMVCKMDAWGISSATLSADYGTVVSGSPSTKWNYFSTPPNSTWVTA